ncbi:MAG TPA: Gfo/Idh/MocA family oxidoreductase [Candidatus Limnocylindrales bacterium]|nr:Gfo/Idh/MocA family oxidoreductase [Candidatus Limnocylindrales bacterium]
MIRVAILSFWHVHATDYAREAIDDPRTQIIGVWDEDAERGRAEAASLGVPFHDDLTELLAVPELDGVIVTTPTNAHRAVMVAAADAGKHIFTEKVLALTPADCQAILDAVERKEVTLTVSLPRLAHGYARAIRAVLDDKRLGEVTLVRTRLSHDGALGEGWLPAHFFDRERAGGGALVDLGCHPMYLTRLFLGEMPDRLTAVFGHLTDRAVEDNAAALLGLSSGAIGVVEAGFVNTSSPFSIEVHGTNGSLFYGTPEPRLLLRTSRSSTGEDWTEVPIPDDSPSPFEQWVGHIEDGTKAVENIALAVELTTLMDAASRSARTGETVRLAADS